MWSLPLARPDMDQVGTVGESRAKFVYSEFTDRRIPYGCRGTRVGDGAVDLEEVSLIRSGLTIPQVLNVGSQIVDTNVSETSRLSQVST